MRTLSLRLLSILTLIVMVIGSGAAIVSAAPPAAHLASTISYTADNATVFTNPERGFHNRYEIINDPSVSDYVTFNSGGCDGNFTDRTFACAKASGNTIIHSYIHLDKYTAVDLPQALLDNLSSGLAAIRAAGLKIILRPAYVWGAIPNVTEAQTIRHIDQLDAVISANSDVVLHMETGYLGQWGEWHDGIYVDPSVQAQSDNRYRIVTEILHTLPASIPIVIRYPVYIKELMDRTTAPAGGTLLTQADKDRIGFHNDCFLYNDGDRGSYTQPTWMGTFSIAQEEQWVYDLSTSYGGNKMAGGETCDGSGHNDSAGVTVQSEMAAINFTEINVDYWSGNINIWKAANLSASGNDPAETAFVRLQRKMGYRLRLIDATFPTAATAGGNFTFSANLSNDGYSSIIKPRPIFLVLESGANRYNLQMSSVDVRKWVSGANALAQQSVTLPSNMPAGTYKLALWLPDSAAGLQSRPEYSIRLANTGTWDAAAGYNVLSNAITISGSGGATATNMPTYTRTPTQTLTPTPTLTPSGYAAYEAESGSNTLAGGAGVVSCSTCSGGNKVGNVGNNAGTLQFNSVNGASAGNYTLTIYYINGDTAARNATMSVNGGTGNNVSFPVTGSWTTVGSLQTTISLNSGSSNTIKFSNASGWAPDFDRITIALNGGPTNTPGPATNTPTKTNTPAPPTNTPVGPTATNTPTGPTATPTAGGTNLLSNPGIESGTTGWAAWGTVGLSQDSGVFHSGSFSLKMFSRSGQASGPKQDITTILNNNGQGTYNLVAWAKSSTGTQTMHVSIVVNGNTYFTCAATSVSTTWTQLACSQNITWSSLTSAYIYVEGVNAGDTGDFNADDFSLTISGGGATPTKTNTPVGPTNTAVPPTNTPTKTNTPVGPTNTPTKTNTPVPPTATPTSAAGLILDNYDGAPAWFNGTANDLGKWTGANGFVNGAGAESGGVLALQYSNSGWFGSDVLQDVSSKTYLVFVIKGAAGGEQNAFHVILGGVENTLGALSGDTITTSYKTIRINMSTAGMNRAAPGQLQLTFWWGASGTVTIDEIRFE